MKYTVRGYYQYTAYDKIWITVDDASSPEEALTKAQANPENYNIDYKNVDLGDGEYISPEDWTVSEE